MPRHDRAHGVWHSSRPGGGNIGRKARVRSALSRAVGRKSTYQRKTGR